MRKRTNTRDFIGLQFFAAPPAGDRLSQIEARLSQIRTEMDQDGADLEALSNEVDNLFAERGQLQQGAETRAALLRKIGSGAAGIPLPGMQLPADPEQRSEEYTSDSPEYRTAWVKHLRRSVGISDQLNQMTEAEQRAFTTVTGSAGAAVPTQTAGTILEKVTQYAPLLSKINLLRVPGMVTFAVEDTVNTAEKHAQNAAISAKEDKLKSITLSAYEITKLVQISKSVAMMSIPAFETWLTDMLARKIADKLTETILLGTGTDEGTGIDKAAVWDHSTNSVQVGSAASLTTQDVLNLIALLPGGYDARAEFIMSKKTLFTDVMPLQDKSKNDIVTMSGSNYYVFGYPVQLDERVKLHEAYLGDLYTVIGNMPEDVTITSAFDIDTNSYKFLGCAMFDCKPSMSDAIVKLEKADA